MEETQINKKTILGLSVLLMLMMLPIGMAAGTTLSIEPDYISRYVNQSFTTDIDVTDVIDLYGFQLNITWNKAKIRCNNDNLNEAMDNLWGVGNWFAWPQTEEQRINNTIGLYSVMVTALASGDGDLGTPTDVNHDGKINVLDLTEMGLIGPMSTSPFTGDTTLVTLTYKAIGTGSTTIGFIYQTILVNSTVEEISHTQTNSTVYISSPSVGKGKEDEIDRQALKEVLVIQHTAPYIAIGLAILIPIAVFVYHIKRKKQ